MNYRFEISSPEKSDFACEIVVDGDKDFLQFHNKIAEALHFDASKRASFFAIDKEGTRGVEVALMEVPGADASVLLMNSTLVTDIINASCLELEYVFDIVENRYLKVEYAGAYRGDTAEIPFCAYSKGTRPRQSLVVPKRKGENLDDLEDSFLKDFGSMRAAKSHKYKDDDDFLENFGNDEFSDDFSGEFDDELGDDTKGDRFDSIDDYIDRL